VELLLKGSVEARISRIHAREVQALNTDLFPTHAGALQGVATCFFAFAGIISPALTGFLVHFSSSFQAPIFVVAILSAIAGLLSLFVEQIRK
jgi:MFS family permease